MMYRSSAELERDIAEFLIARYEDRQNENVVRLFHRWIETRAPTSGSNIAPAGSVQSDGLLQWIDRNASSMNLSPDDVREIGTDIRTLLQSMAAPAEGFICS
jgi:hypothetical protein